MSLHRRTFHIIYLNFNDLDVVMVSGYDAMKFRNMVIISGPGRRGEGEEEVGEGRLRQGRIDRQAFVQ